MEYMDPSVNLHGRQASGRRGSSSDLADQLGVMIADRHSVVRDGMRRILDLDPGPRVVATVANSEAVAESVRSQRPHLLLIDSDLFFLMHILQQISTVADTAVVLFTTKLSHDEALLAVRLGVRGIVRKDAPVETVVQCIRRVLAGEHWIERELLAEAVRVPQPQANQFDLSSRELEIIANIVSGACNKEIAQRLGISDLTVKRHLTNVYNKVGVSGRLELALFALAHNLAHARKPAAGISSAAALRNAQVHSFGLPR